MPERNEMVKASELRVGDKLALYSHGDTNPDHCKAQLKKGELGAVDPRDVTPKSNPAGSCPHCGQAVYLRHELVRAVEFPPIPRTVAVAAGDDPEVHPYLLFRPEQMVEVVRRYVPSAEEEYERRLDYALTHRDRELNPE